MKLTKEEIMELEMLFLNTDHTYASLSRKFKISSEAVRSLLIRRGHKSKNNFRDTWKKDIGKKFGKITVNKRVANSKFNTVRYECQCDCGAIFISYASALRSGATVSCGCKKKTPKRSGTGPSNRLYRSYVNMAKKRNIVFDLTKELFLKLIFKNCYYCGSEPNRIQYGYTRTRYSQGQNTDEYIVVNGIDRFNNNVGYIENNVVPCCEMCNKTKMDKDVGDFFAHIKKIYLNQNLGDIN